MNWNNTRAGYGALPIALHWLMLLLIAGAYTAMELRSIFPKGSPERDAMASWHYLLGLSVFFLVWLRLLARLPGVAPVVEPALPARQAALARLVQWALYALMAGLPLLGWLALSAKGGPVPFLGVELPLLVGKSAELARLFKKLHEAGATLGYLLIGLHAGAALYHHYVTRDNTLKLMLPAA